jgi:hypothetical protein
VRVTPKVFRIAAKVVKQLGLFQYSAMHVRRNELQYSEYKISASEIGDKVSAVFEPRQPLTAALQVSAMFEPGEPLYIATDEVGGRRPGRPPINH